MPAVDERARHDLFEAVQTTFGSRHADTLMSLLPPVGWADVATKDDLHALEGRLELRFDAVDQRITAVEQRFEQRFTGIDQRFDAIDQRFRGMEQHVDDKLETLEHRLLAAMHSSQRSLVFGLVGAVAAMASVCIAAITAVT